MPAACITRLLDWKNGSSAASDAPMGSTVTGVSYVTTAINAPKPMSWYHTFLRCSSYKKTPRTDEGTWRKMDTMLQKNPH